MQFVKHFAPPPPQKNAASRLEGREQASGSLLGQSVQSGTEVRPSGVEYRRLKAQTNSVHSKKKTPENQLDLYVDCTETRRRMPQPRLYAGVRRIIWKTGAHLSRLTMDCYILRLCSLHKLSNGGEKKQKKNSIFPQLR